MPGLLLASSLTSITASRLSHEEWIHWCYFMPDTIKLIPRSGYTHFRMCYKWNYLVAEGNRDEFYISLISFKWSTWCHYLYYGLNVIPVGSFVNLFIAFKEFQEPNMNFTAAQGCTVANFKILSTCHHTTSPEKFHFWFLHKMKCWEVCQLY